MNIFPFILKPCLVSFYVYKTNEARIRLKGCWMGGGGRRVLSGWEVCSHFTIKNKDTPARPYPNLLSNSLFNDLISFHFSFVLFSVF